MRTSLILAFTAAAAAIPLSPETSLAASTLVVNSAQDTTDLRCDPLDEAAGLECTLREAIQASNESAGVDVISFNIPTAAPWTIAVTSPLPTVSDPAVIDGTTQPGHAGRPVVELNGALAGTATQGLRVTAGDTTIRGLSITSFGGTGLALESGGGNVVKGSFLGVGVSGLPLGNGLDGISIAGRGANVVGGAEPGAANVISGNGRHGVNVYLAGGNSISGNLIGTDPSGSVDVGNAQDGIFLNGSRDNAVGGISPGAGNVVSGNDRFGIDIYQPSATNNVVQGNLVGTDVRGLLPLGNTNDGVFIHDAPANTIGGSSIGARNVFAANRYGVVIQSPGARGNLVMGNYVGTDVTGAASLGNWDDGVFIENAPSNVIGGATEGTGNVISGNLGSGVHVWASDSTGNRILGNRIGSDAAGSAALGNAEHGVLVHDATGTEIGGAAGNLISSNGGQGVHLIGGMGTTVRRNGIYGNGDLGIDLSLPAGMTRNDPGDTDTGANGLQNFPVLTRSISRDGALIVRGTLDSVAGAAFTIDFYAGPSCDPLGYGEGQFFLRSLVVTTDASGVVRFRRRIVADVSSGWVVTATATDATGNTSEFSACRPVSGT